MAVVGDCTVVGSTLRGGYPDVSPAQHAGYLAANCIVELGLTSVHSKRTHAYLSVGVTCTCTPRTLKHTTIA